MKTIVAIASGLIAIFSTAVQGQDLPVQTGARPNIPIRGCIAFQHRDYRGSKFTFNGNLDVKYIGDRWNDQISSFACGRGCEMTIYEHRDFVNRLATLTHTSYVGEAFNDRISSLKVRCK